MTREDVVAEIGAVLEGEPVSYHTFQLLVDEVMRLISYAVADEEARKLLRDLIDMSRYPR